MTIAPHSPFLRQLWRDTVKSWMPAFITACGFLLSLGWVWFNSTFSLAIADMPKVFSGTLFSGDGIDMFAAALVGGFVAYGIAAKRLAQRDERLPAMLAHGCALACMTAGALGREAYPHVSAALFGVAAAAPGVYWTTRLVSLPPVLAGAAIALAALMAFILASAITVWPLALVLPTGIVLALGLSCIHEPPQAHGKFNLFLSANAVRAPMRISAGGWRNVLMRDDVMTLIALSSAFFSFGILASSGLVPTFLALPISAIGVAVVTAFCVRRLNGAFGTALLAAAMVLPAGLHILALPGLPGAPAFIGGMMEGAAIIAMARWRRERAGTAGEAIHPPDFYGAGVFLAILFVLVNAGGLVGGAVTKTGGSGYRLMATVCIALGPLALLLAAKWLDRQPGGNEREEPKPAETGHFHEEEFAVIGATKSGLDSYIGSRSLTSREREIAFHILRGRSTREMAAEFCITEHTVKTHVKNVLKKFNLSNRKAFVSSYLLQMEELDKPTSPYPPRK